MKTTPTSKLTRTRFLVLGLSLATAIWVTACSQQSGESESESAAESSPAPQSTSQLSEAMSQAAQSVKGGAESMAEEATESVEHAREAAEDVADAAIIEAQESTYPLKTCVVSGEELGAMGDAVKYIHEGRLMMFCCEDCIPKFKEDPERYLAKLDAAKENQEN